MDFNFAHTRSMQTLKFGHNFLRNTFLANKRNTYGVFTTKRQFSLSNRIDNQTKVNLKPYELHKLQESDFPTSAIITVDDAKRYLFDMILIRQMEQESNRLYKEKSIRGFCHLYSGQEACCVGIQASIHPDDSVITAYRAHGWAYVKGQTVSAILSELTGRETGCAKGKGGSMHMYSHEFYGGNGIVGAQVPVGAGIAFSHKLLKNNKICISLYGDGAANQGQVFEAFNMAALWKLPIIFICENNHYGMGTSTTRSSASDLYYTRGDYIPGIKVDGSCVISVREATKVAAEYVRSGKGPLVIELNTYRYFGHSMSDPGTSYRNQEEVQSMRKSQDPIKLLTEMILEGSLMTEAEIQKVNEEVAEIVEKAAEEAITAPFPAESELTTHIYSGEKTAIRGCDPFTHFPAV